MLTSGPDKEPDSDPVDKLLHDKRSASRHEMNDGHDDLGEGVLKPGTSELIEPLSEGENRPESANSLGFDVLEVPQGPRSF